MATEIMNVAAEVIPKGNSVFLVLSIAFTQQM